MSRVTVFLLAVFLLAVLMASSAHAEISHYYQQPNGWTTDPILDIYGNKHSWAGTGDIWHNATVTDLGEVTYSSVTQRIIANGLDIRGEVKTANITSGVIDFFCVYIPLSEGAQVVEG